jgi:hypothetical protein
MEVAVAVLPDAGDTVEVVSERFDLWPFRHDQLIEDLAASGLAVETSTFADDVDRYLVVARSVRLDVRPYVWLTSPGTFRTP